MSTTPDHLVANVKANVDHISEPVTAAPRRGPAVRHRAVRHLTGDLSEDEALRLIREA